MTHILRLAKDKQNPYVVISNELAENDTLSFAARGMMLYLLAKRDDWTVRMTDLENASNSQGRTAVRSIFAELEKAGYVKRTKKRSADGKWSYETTVYESPRLAGTEEEETTDGLPVDGFSVDGSPADGSLVDITSTHSPSTHLRDDASASSQRGGVVGESEPEKPPPKERRQLSPLQRQQNAMRRAVTEHFEQRTGLQCPERGTTKGIATLWWNPIREMCEGAEWDIDRAKRLIDLTLAKMDGLTVTDPNSILKTSRAVVAEHRRSRAPRKRSADGAIRMPSTSGGRR